MKTVTFSCEPITPIFMYGADGKSPELRPASIKGVMRFWWRAINGDLPLDDLKKQEDEIFGSTEKRSSFSIRVNEDLKSKKEYPLPHKKKGDKGYHQKNAFIANQTFQVIFRGKNLELISNIFKLLTLLGGFGQRSRRGFGSIRIKEDDTLISIEEIKKLIKSINPKFEYNHRNKSKNEQYPYIKKIQLGRSYSSYNELVKKISTATSGKCGKYLFKDDRLASPIYVSIVKFDKNDFRPIVTTLNSVSEKYIKFNEMLKIQDDFKKAIL
jgi:CRISPR-associated protein Cmr1